MTKGKRRLFIALAVLVLGALIIRVIVLEERCGYLQESIDLRFRSHFSSLCLGIPAPEDITEEALTYKNEENLKDAHICWTLYGLTSHKSVSMNNIVKILYDLCVARLQRDVVDKELAGRLAELPIRDFDEEKARSAWEALKERMEETGVDPYR